ncbi:hypothetical protein [Clostridium beijerinckii]|uniref:Uncharacterized protein n=1 Tax=Clostridium beijerinckii TaxID=1520 RepID=A0AAE5LRG8_CLOBE|nr:hypothetical protein [Clostridium beijerinckii]NSB15957.1 hypothetical protein [Clostridium beijerinckii]
MLAALEKLLATDKVLSAYGYFENKVYGMEREFWNAIHGKNYYG